MRRIYLDTSVLVAALVHEAGTEIALRFLRSHAQQPWLISPWVSTELASALALQVSRGVISPAEAQESWRRFQVLLDHRLQNLPLAAEDFHSAAGLCLGEAPPLRAGDALHLALCLRLNLQRASFDHGLCKAAHHHQVANRQLLIPS